MGKYKIGDLANGEKTSEQIIEARDEVHALRQIIADNNKYCEPIEDINIDMFKEFPITTICREDLKQCCSDSEIELFTDTDMERVANKMSNAYLENGYWIDLRIIAEQILEDKKGKENE